MLYRRAISAWNHVTSAPGAVALFNGDCRKLLSVIPDNSVAMVVTSPPYCIGKEYESATDVDDFRSFHSEIIPDVIRVLRPGGSMCWQVGYHVRNNAVVPLDYLVYEAVQNLTKEMTLRNRIVWHFGHGQHCDKRF